MRLAVTSQRKRTVNATPEIIRSSKSMMPDLLIKHQRKSWKDKVIIENSGMSRATLEVNKEMAQTINTFMEYGRPQTQK